jgi:hypothetical protein
LFLSSRSHDEAEKVKDRTKARNEQQKRKNTKQNKMNVGAKSQLRSADHDKA